MQVKTIQQNKLTGECFLVQFWGESACKTCEYRNKKDCGGKTIRKTKQNAKGHKVPL